MAFALLGLVMLMRETEHGTGWPSLKTIERWLDEGGCEATDGCWVAKERNACEHDKPTWAYVLGAVSDAHDRVDDGTRPGYVSRGDRRIRPPAPAR